MCKQIFYSFFVLMTLISSGCFHHCYHSRPISLQHTQIEHNVKRAFSSEIITPGAFCDKQWWHFFKDAQLDRLIGIALVCQPDIKIAEARIRLAYQEAMIARSKLFPHIFAVGEIGQQKVSEFGPGFVPGFPDHFTKATLELTTAMYELDLWKKNRSLYCAALDEMYATIANYEESKLLLSTSIAAVYFDLQMALMLKELTQKRLDAKQELYKLHKQQFDFGISSEFRIYEVDTDVQFLKDLLFQIGAEIEIDHHILAALVGNIASFCREDGSLNLAPSAQFNEPFPLPATLPIDLLVRRPDITAQKWLIEASCYDIKAARANFYPRIDLVGWIGFNSILMSELFTGKSLIGLADAQATLPLFTAGKLKAQLGIAQENLEIAIANYNGLVLQAVRQVSDALTQLITAADRENSARHSIEDALKLFQLTQQKFEKGISNKLTVLNASENLYVQKELEIRAQNLRFEAAVKLIKAIGGGYYECQR